MGAIPQTMMEEIALRAQEECSDNSAAFLSRVIRDQPDFAVTPAWIASAAAALSAKAKALSEEPREIAQDYLDDLYIAMKACK